ncbi:MAG: hypothetical protein KJZ78_24200, partial [Bryobacteraceae bacterium]|nr:hypothetical protein [Bryobacteraceae bacterium]
MKPVSRGFLLAAMSAAVLSAAAPAAPTVAEAQAFMEKVESTVMRLSEEAGRASWVQATYITYDTEILAAQATEKSISANVAFAKEAK